MVSVWKLLASTAAVSWGIGIGPLVLLLRADVVPTSVAFALVLLLSAGAGYVVATRYRNVPERTVWLFNLGTFGLFFLVYLVLDTILGHDRPAVELGVIVLAWLLGMATSHLILRERGLIERRNGG